MVPIEHLRRNVLKLTQAELAAICGKAQATVSRWESGELEPDAADLRAILACAPARKAKLKAADLLLPTPEAA